MTAHPNPLTNLTCQHAIEHVEPWKRPMARRFDRDTNPLPLTSRLAGTTGAATPPAAPVSNSGGDAIAAVTAKSQLADPSVVDPSPPEPIKRRHALRPFCQHPYEEACGGYGDRHCTTCRKAMKDAGTNGAEAPASGATDTDTSGGERGRG